MATYQIIIKLPGQGEQQSVVSGQKKTTSSNTPKQTSKAEKTMMGIVSYSTISHFVDNLVTYDISQVELTTGAKEYEQKLQFHYGVAKKGLGIIVAGITGGLTGAGIAALGTAIYSAISYGQSMMAIERKQHLEDISIGMASIRAGISGRRSPNQ